MRGPGSNVASVTEQPAVQLSSAPSDVSCAQVVLHQPEYAGPCVQGGADVVLGGLEQMQAI
jgi:hypothetical protein